MGIFFSLSTTTFITELARHTTSIMHTQVYLDRTPAATFGNSFSFIRRSVSPLHKPRSYRSTDCTELTFDSLFESLNYFMYVRVVVSTHACVTLKIFFFPNTPTRRTRRKNYFLFDSKLFPPWSLASFYSLEDCFSRRCAKVAKVELVKSQVVVRVCKRTYVQVPPSSGKIAKPFFSFFPVSLSLLLLWPENPCIRERSKSACLYLLCKARPDISSTALSSAKIELLLRARPCASICLSVRPSVKRGNGRRGAVNKHTPATGDNCALWKTGLAVGTKDLGVSSTPVSYL